MISNFKDFATLLGVILLALVVYDLGVKKILPGYEAEMPPAE